MYRINGWNDNFEWNESRRLVAPAKCAHPNRFGKGLRRLARLPDGAMIYGLFVALCNVNSARRPEQRLDGFLTDDGTASGEPWTVDDFADFTGFSSSDFERMVDVLTTPRFGWMTDVPGQPGEIPRTNATGEPDERTESPATVPNDRQTEQTEQNRQTGGDAESPSGIVKFATFAPGIMDRDAIVSEINNARRDRGLSELVGHFAAVPVDRALREPGVRREMLSNVIRYEFAKFDRSDDRDSVVTHLEPGNMFRSQYLTGTIDRAKRWADDPGQYDWGSSRDGISDSEWERYVKAGGSK